MNEELKRLNRENKALRAMVEERNLEISALKARITRMISKHKKLLDKYEGKPLSTADVPDFLQDLFRGKI